MEDDDLLNIKTFQDFIVIKYYKKLIDTGLMLNDSESLIFWIRYKDRDGEIQLFQYNILGHNFIMTDSQFLVNKETIEVISSEIEKRLSFVLNTFKAD